MRPLIFRQSAQAAHESMLCWLRWGDQYIWAQAVLRQIHRAAFARQEVKVGDVTLDSPLILAAGLVKGVGFTSETAAREAVMRGQNIIPGWRCLPALLGPVEFGSFTRWPRPGNPGTVVWRDAATQSTQNRVGLRNPGAQAAAHFLSLHRLPQTMGINIAVSPGVDDPAQEQQEVLVALAAFIEYGVYPAWFTLNLSCPNTEDDPGGRQTEANTRRLCRAVQDYLRGTAAQRAGRTIPLWVKIGPTLADEQLRLLMRVFAAEGVNAVIATNTLPEPAPDDLGVQAGVAGGRLHRRAVETARVLMQEQHTRNYQVDVIGCGGVLDGTAYRDFARLGVQAVQYWSALVYRGPLAAALIAQERKASHD